MCDISWPLSESKIKVYSDNPHILNELQQTIQETFTSIEVGEHCTLYIISF
jgi:hypothetical protein